MILQNISYLIFKRPVFSLGFLYFSSHRGSKTYRRIKASTSSICGFSATSETLYALEMLRSSVNFKNMNKNQLYQSENAILLDRWESRCLPFHTLIFPNRTTHIILFWPSTWTALLISSANLPHKTKGRRSSLQNKGDTTFISCIRRGF